MGSRTVAAPQAAVTDDRSEKHESNGARPYPPDSSSTRLDAAGLGAEMDAETDQERLLIERQVAAVEHSAPGSTQAAEAEAAGAQAARVGDEATVLRVSMPCNSPVAVLSAALISA